MTDDAPPEIREDDEVTFDGDRYEVKEVYDDGFVYAERKSDGKGILFRPEDAVGDGPVTLIPAEVLEQGEDAVDEYLSE